MPGESKAEGAPSCPKTGDSMGTSCAHCARRSNLSGTEAASAQDGVAAWTARSYANSNAPSARTSSSRQSTRSPPHRAPWVGEPSGRSKRATRRMPPSPVGWRRAVAFSTSTWRSGEPELDSSTRYCATCRRKFSAPACCTARAGSTSVISTDRPAVGRDGRAVIPTPW